MQSIINADNFSIYIEGSTIRVTDEAQVYGSAEQNSNYDKVGIVSILPKIQIGLGENFKVFVKALTISRTPLALRKRIQRGPYRSYEIVRLATGNIKDALICTIDTINDRVVGLAYNQAIIKDKEFRRYVKLSIMHQLVLCNKSEQNRLFLATKCISILTNTKRESLVVSETARTVKVKANCKRGIKLPVNYIFALMPNTNSYSLYQIAYDYNEAAKKLEAKS